jgi:hypothetical protein
MSKWKSKSKIIDNDQRNESNNSIIITRLCTGSQRHSKKC